jgi:hypothetical protein
MSIISTLKSKYRKTKTQYNKLRDKIHQLENKKVAAINDIEEIRLAYIKEVYGLSYDDVVTGELPGSGLGYLVFTSIYTEIDELDTFIIAKSIEGNNVNFNAGLVLHPKHLKRVGKYDYTTKQITFIPENK